MSTRLPASSSDVRLVLEANIRATQLAFQHNERTLTASLRMADTLREGVHVLAESQADWIKAVASSRGFSRNAAPPALLVPPAPIESHTDDEEDDDTSYEPPKEERKNKPTEVRSKKIIFKNRAARAHGLQPHARRASSRRSACGPSTFQRDEIRAARGKTVAKVEDFAGGERSLSAT